MKMKSLLVLTTLMGTTCAQAGTATNVTITNIEANSQGQFLIWLSNAMINSPACAVQPAIQVIVDGNTVGGRLMVSVVESAFALGKVLVVTGNNACDVHSGYETVTDIATN